MFLLSLDQASLIGICARATPAPQPEPNQGEHDFNSPTPDRSTIVKLLTLVSVFGWVFFGIMSIMCINGQGRAGRWVPEWYLDARGSRWDKTMVVIWWAAVVLVWPVILPALVVKNGVRGMVKHCRGRGGRDERDEEERGEQKSEGEAGEGEERYEGEGEDQRGGPDEAK